MLYTPIIQNEVKVEQDTDQNALKSHDWHPEMGWRSIRAWKNELDRLGAACEETTNFSRKIEQSKASKPLKPDPPHSRILMMWFVLKMWCITNCMIVAEDHAIEDTIYVLSKALDRDQIKLEPFMKHTRTLAREQFLKKALVVKISSHLAYNETKKFPFFSV